MFKRKYKDMKWRLYSLFGVNCKDKSSESLAIQPFKSEENEYVHLKKNFHPKHKERLRQLQDFMTARVVTLKPDEFIPVHPDGDDSYVHKEGTARLNQGTFNKNIKNYFLAREQQADSKTNVLLIFLSEPGFKTKNTFLEIFPKTSDCLRFETSPNDCDLNIGTFNDNYLKCKVPIEQFETCLNALKNNSRL
ncbi:hypothetical protein BgiBS90_007912 [Biomphalaria glabrata]|nr:hypothetical protein BgiBS90_007912 [Biomphalaria glabrata]